MSISNLYISLFCKKRQKLQNLSFGIKTKLRVKLNAFIYIFYQSIKFIYLDLICLYLDMFLLVDHILHINRVQLSLFILKIYKKNYIIYY